MTTKTKFKQTEIGMIPEDWEVKELQEEVDINMGQSPKSEFYNESGEGCFFMQGVKTFGEKYPTFDTYTTQITKEAKAGSVLFSVRAPVGEVNITKKNLCIGRGLSALNMKNGNNEFLYYLLKKFKTRILNFETGSVFGAINETQIKRLKLPFPKETDQKSIAKILSDLDAKIELNQQMNKTLEAIGQAIFKRWFVDFEFPNEEGKPYKSSGGEMVYNEELGKEIPKGWKVKNYGDLLIFERGIEPGSKSYFDKPFENSIKFYRVGDMLDNSMCSTYIDISLAKNVKSEREDILVSFDGTVGRVQTGVVGAYSTGIRKVNSKDNHFSKAFIYFLMKSKLIQETIIKFATGTTILHASESLKYMCETIPDQETSNKFSSVINPFFRKIILCKERIQTLSQIRDSLLPKLMLGKIRVPVNIIK